MVDSGTVTCPEQESAWCHFGTRGGFFCITLLAVINCHIGTSGQPYHVNHIHTYSK